MSRIEDGGAVEAGRDIWEVSNQLAGYVDERTPQDLCDFLIRESKAAADLAAKITRLRAENAGMREAQASLVGGYRLMHTALCHIAGTSGADRHWYVHKAQAACGKIVQVDELLRAALSKASQAEGQTT